MSVWSAWCASAACVLARLVRLVRVHPHLHLLLHDGRIVDSLLPEGDGQQSAEAWRRRQEALSGERTALLQLGHDEGMLVKTGGRREREKSSGKSAPKTLRKYHDKEETYVTSRDCRST